MTLSADALIELDWWINNISTCYGLITLPDPDCTLTTDASNKGWGAVYEDESTGGVWTSEEKAHHINYLELLAVYLGMQTFLFHPQKQTCQAYDRQQRSSRCD